jgi:hypothetical protein
MKWNNIMSDIINHLKYTKMEISMSSAKNGEIFTLVVLGVELRALNLQGRHFIT